MDILHTLILTVHVLAALGVVGLVLLQHGKGADMGAAFGSGASGSLFGATGSANFLSRSTAVCATVFFAATLALAFFANDRGVRPAGGTSVLESVPAAAPAASVPAVAASAAVAPAAAASTGAGAVPSK